MPPTPFIKGGNEAFPPDLVCVLASRDEDHPRVLRCAREKRRPSAFSRPAASVQPETYTRVFAPTEARNTRRLIALCSATPASERAPSSGPQALSLSLPAKRSEALPRAATVATRTWLRPASPPRPTGTSPLRVGSSFRKMGVGETASSRSVGDSSSVYIAARVSEPVNEQALAAGRPLATYFYPRRQREAAELSRAFSRSARLDS